MEPFVFTAIKDGVDIKGYTSWSLLDKFEWEKGYADKYGFYYVEFNVRNKPRYPKASVQYYKEIDQVSPLFKSSMATSLSINKSQVLRGTGPFFPHLKRQ